MGGSLFFGRTWENGKQVVPQIDLGFDQTQDPAAGLFTTTAFQGASAAQLTDARALYAVLTGRVRAVTGQAALDADTNKYVAFGERRRAGNMDEYSAFIQDSWRVSPTLTDQRRPALGCADAVRAVERHHDGGVTGQHLRRSPASAPATLTARATSSIPSASGGTVPQFDQLTKGTLGYNTDWNNMAPNIGVAWRPGVESGFMRTLLGDPEQATMRAGYSVAYERQGLGVFTGVFGANPGSTLSLTRDVDTGLVGPGETWPVLLREPAACTTRRFRRHRRSRSRSGRTAPITSRASIPISRWRPPAPGR